MWKLEIIGKQYYLNTQDAVYEVLTKTPEHILCERADAVKIDMMVKQSQTAEPDEQFGVRFVPYRNVQTDIVYDPNSSKNCPRNLALAIAYIAADKPDWTRFIPVGLKARELSKEQHRRDEVIAKQREPFQKKNKAGKDEEEEEEEEFEICDNAINRNVFRDLDSDDSEDRRDQHTVDSDDDVDDKLLVYDHKTGEFVKPTEEEEQEFDENIGTILTGGSQAKTENDPEYASIFGGKALQNQESMDDLYARVAKVRSEQEQQLHEKETTLPSDLKRRQAAILSDPNAEPLLSELTQSNRTATNFNLNQERDAAKAKECGVVNIGEKTTSNVLDRFAPQQPPIVKPIASRPQTNPSQYTVADLMKFGAATKLPPSIQQEISRNKQNGETKVETDQKIVPPPTAVSTSSFSNSSSNSSSSNSSSKIAQKLKEIRRKHVELMLLYADLDEMF